MEIDSVKKIHSQKIDNKAIPDCLFKTKFHAFSKHQNWIHSLIGKAIKCWPNLQFFTIKYLLEEGLILSLLFRIIFLEQFYHDFIGVSQRGQRKWGDKSRSLVCRRDPKGYDRKVGEALEKNPKVLWQNPKISLKWMVSQMPNKRLTSGYFVFNKVFLFC